MVIRVCGSEKGAGRRRMKGQWTGFLTGCQNVCLPRKDDCGPLRVGALGRQRASFMRTLCYQVSDSWGCLLLWLGLTPRGSASQLHRGSPSPTACSPPSFASPQLCAHPPSDPSFFGPDFWQSSDLDILKGQSYDFLRGCFWLLLLVLFSFVSCLHRSGIFFNAGKFIYQHRPLADRLGFCLQKMRLLFPVDVVSVCSSDLDLNEPSSSDILCWNTHFDTCLHHPSQVTMLCGYSWAFLVAVDFALRGPCEQRLGGKCCVLRPPTACQL